VNDDERSSGGAGKPRHDHRVAADRFDAAMEADCRGRRACGGDATEHEKERSDDRTRHAGIIDAGGGDLDGR
jgi:hypothetical protein